MPPSCSSPEPEQPDQYPANQTNRSTDEELEGQDSGPSRGNKNPSCADCRHNADRRAKHPGWEKRAKQNEGRRAPAHTAAAQQKHGDQTVRNAPVSLVSIEQSDFQPAPLLRRSFVDAINGDDAPAGGGFLGKFCLPSSAKPAKAVRIRLGARAAEEHITSPPIASPRGATPLLCALVTDWKKLFKRMGAKTIEMAASHLSLISHPDTITQRITAPRPAPKTRSLRLHHPPVRRRPSSPTLAD